MQEIILAPDWCHWLIGSICMQEIILAPHWWQWLSGSICMQEIILAPDWWHWLIGSICMQEIILAPHWWHWLIGSILAPLLVTFEKDEKCMPQVTCVICNTTMGNVTSRLCPSSTPLLSLKGLKCLVACCGSEIHMDSRDGTNKNEGEEESLL